MGHEEVKIPPQNAEAEMSVLGAMLIDEDAIGVVIENLKEVDFYSKNHQVIFSSIVKLYSQNRNVDLITLSDQLENDKLLEAMGGVTYLSQLMGLVPSAANVEHYVEIVKEKSTRRKLIKNANEILQNSFSAPVNIHELIDSSERLIFEITSFQENQKSVHIKEVIRDTIHLIDNLYQRKETITGVPTGFKDFDHMTCGLQKSDLIVVAGRPSMGKSAFVATLAEYAAIEKKTGVAFFSLEMSKEQLVQRMLCSHAGVDAHKVRSGFLSPSDWPLLTAAAGKLSAAPIFIDDTPAISVLELRAKARRLKARLENNIQLLVVDYLQLMRSVYKSESRQQEISEISRSLKALARELEIPLIAISQLSRAVESRQDHVPQLSDLRESGAIEQDADVVVLLMREEYYNPTDENRGIADVIVAKQRNGPVGKIKLKFFKDYVRFVDLEQRFEERVYAE